MKRLFDLVIALPLLILVSPILLVIAVLIKLNSKGPIFFLQQRVGLNGADFFIYKFRTMQIGADKMGLLTVGGRDPRVTSVGYFLRKYKLDELPQLINVVNGTMSLVGPRPEVRKYVDLYNSDQRMVLNAKPGITDYASIEYADENNLLASSENPERTYIDEIMPAKLKLNMKYIAEQGVITDIKIIFSTVMRVIRGH
ncbi:MAG TPA: sugar transferase [Bacteroidia bacterium]|nr:sugar transferase [Bacteroidia bacterium]HQF28255.1 sugar transferase [Bacteroidia bacterium]HQK98333.1 sugar transferase [Bacteroidia bacterium]